MSFPLASLGADGRTQVWRCTICDGIALSDELARTQIGPELCIACPKCRSPHVFPALDGQWCRPQAAHES